MCYLYSLPVVKENKEVLLSNNLCQDPLEKFFGYQRQRGGTISNNPNIAEFIKNTQALKVVDHSSLWSGQGQLQKVERE